jgi:hypothetical protein
MLVNSSLTAPGAQLDRVATTRPPAQPDGVAPEGDSAAAGVSSGLDPQFGDGVAASGAQSQIESTSVQLDTVAESLNAALPDITSTAEAQAGVAAAINSILNHSSFALLAQGGHTPESVLALLSQ